MLVAQAHRSQVQDELYLEQKSYAIVRSLSSCCPKVSVALDFSTDDAVVFANLSFLCSIAETADA